MLKIYLKLLQKYRPSAGWTLAELMIAASMTLMVVMASGFGLIMILKENKVANATGEMQYDLNRAAEFINEEIRSAKTIEYEGDINKLKDYAPTFFKKYPGKTPILVLKIDGIYERVVYYVDEIDEDQPWHGPGEIKCFGPLFFQDGGHIDPDDQSNDKGRKPDEWTSLTLVDKMVLDLDEERKDCRNLTRDDTNEGEYTDSEGNRWYRFPRKTEEVKGFFACVRGDKQLAQVNLLGTTLEEFEHLGYGTENIRSKESRHGDKMEYEVVTMAHARSELSGGNGTRIPRYRVTPPIVFEEDGHATIDVLHVKIPCYNETTSTEVETVFYTSDLNAEGLVEGTVRGDTVSFKKNQAANFHITETSSGGYSYKNRQDQINLNDGNGRIKYATNDTGNHTKLDHIIDSKSKNFQEIVDLLKSDKLIREADDGTYDFFLPDNKVLYFIEFEFNQLKRDENGNIVRDENRRPIKESQPDPPFHDDAIVLVEVTKSK